MNTLIYRTEAENFINANGWKLFLDRIIKEKIIVLDDKPFIIYERHNVVTDREDYGSIRIIEYPEGLQLWVSGVMVWKSPK